MRNINKLLHNNMAAYCVKAIRMILTKLARMETETTEEETAEEVNQTIDEEVHNHTSSIDDLPIDIVTLIGSRLLARDRSCFRFVCKTWRNSIPIAPNSNSSFKLTEEMINFPHMYTGNEGFMCSFYHPILNTTYISDIPEITDNDSKIQYSKDGWLLMSLKPNHAFFFNPNTRKRIDLPDLPGTYDFRSVCFTSVPTSPDCIVFAIISSDLNFTHFCYIRRDYHTWTKIATGNNRKNFVASHTNPVFHNGVFYCLGRKGELATFELKQHGDNDSWTWTVLVDKQKPALESCYVRKNYLLSDCNGDIICVFEGHMGNSIEIFKTNNSVMTWRKVKSLGDKMLFVSSTGSVISQIRGMENTIFFPWLYKSSSVFYSLKTGKFYTLGSRFSGDNFYGTKFRTNSTWIQLSSDTCPDGNFRWSSG